MLEQDYLSLEKHFGMQSEVSQSKGTNQLGSQIVREIVLPELTKEVNEDKNFVQLRQVYNSLILATWYKKKIKDSILEQVYADKNKVAGVNIDDPQEKWKIYQRYLKAFKKGVYNYIKEEQDSLTQQVIPRKYFSGGVNYAMIGQETAKVLNYTYELPDAAMNNDNNDEIVQTQFNESDLSKIRPVRVLKHAIRAVEMETRITPSILNHEIKADRAMMEIKIPIPKFNIPSPNILQKPIVLDIQPLTSSLAKPQEIQRFIKQIAQLNQNNLSFMKKLALSIGQFGPLKDSEEIWLPIKLNSRVGEFSLFGDYRVVVKGGVKQLKLIKVKAHLYSQLVDDIYLANDETLNLEEAVIRDAQDRVIKVVLPFSNFSALTTYNVEDGHVLFKWLKEGSTWQTNEIGFKVDGNGKLLPFEGALTKKYRYEPQINTLVESLPDVEGVELTFQVRANGGVSVLKLENNSNEYAGILPPGAKALNFGQQVSGEDFFITYREIQMAGGLVVRINPDNPLLAREEASGKIFYFEMLNSSNERRFVGQWQGKDSVAVTNLEEAKNNGWETLDIVPRPLSLRTIEKRGGLHATDLLLVHRTKYLPENGFIKTNMTAQGEKFGRDTIHFTLNHPVASHMYGSWDDAPYTILLPLVKVPKWRIEQLNLIDTWIRGDLELPEGTVVLSTKSLPPNVNLGKARFIQISGNDEKIEAAIADLGYTPTKGGMWSWYGDSWDWTEQQNEFARKEGLNIFLAHTNHWSFAFERFLFHERVYVHDLGEQGGVTRYSVVTHSEFISGLTSEAYIQYPLFAKVALVQKLGDEIIKYIGVETWPRYYEEYVPKELKNVLGTAEQALKIPWNDYAHWRALESDNAQVSGVSKTLGVEKNGGIDLTSSNMNLQIKNSGGSIRFHLDPAMLQRLQNSPGFTPVIINIQPMIDLRIFLGITSS